MNKYEKTFHSRSGEEFRADVYSVLAAFAVECPARQHAIKKLLMPGQRGDKGEIQDLDEALVSVSRAVDMARARLRGSDGANGEPEPMAEPEPEPKKPKLVTWRLCVRIDEPAEIEEGALYVKWYPSGGIPEHWYPIEAQSQPVETVMQLSKGWEP